MNPTLASFIGPQGNPGTIGLNALNAARDFGYSDEKIKEMLKEENLGLGKKAKESLSV